MPLLEIIKGLMVTARHLTRKPVTVQYPEQKKDYAPRYHGRHQLNRYDDGLEKCIGCELCAWACPADAIYVQGADNAPESRFSPGERYAVDYQINYLRCIFCGLCIEACPTRALTMTAEDEVTGITREAMIFTKDMLLAPVSAGGHETPHTDAEVRASGQSYYGGPAMTISTASAERAGQVAPHGGSAQAGLGAPPEISAQPAEPASIPTPAGEAAPETRPTFTPESRSEDIVPPGGGDVSQARAERQLVEPEENA